MVVLDELCAEVLEVIGTLLHQSSRNSIFSLIRVNTRLYDVFLPFIYRQCTFDFTKNPGYKARKGLQTPLNLTQSRLQSFLENITGHIIFDSVRKVIVKATGFRSDDDNHISTLIEGSEWASMTAFVSRMSHLEEIIFDCTQPVPITLLAVLHERHPTSQLHVRNWTRRAPDVKVGDPHEEALARSICLRSIEACFTTGGDDAMDLNVPALKRIITLAPNIESATLRTLSEGGCVMYGQSIEEVEEESREAAKFDVEDAPPKVMRKLEWYYTSAYSIPHLERTVDLSQLEALDAREMDHTGCLHALQHSTFRGLRHLSFTLPGSNTEEWSLSGERSPTVTAFIVSLSPLLSLSIINYADYVDVAAVLLHHGATLRSNHDKLTILGTGAPNLEFLAIDINRTADQANEAAIYAGVSAFPNLTRVALHCDLGLRHATKYHSEVDRNFVEQVWWSLDGEKHRRQLEELTLFIGEQDRDIGFGYPADWVFYENDARQKLRVTRNERDDKTDEICVTGSNLKGGQDVHEIDELKELQEAMAGWNEDNSSTADSEEYDSDRDMGF
ncbi:hypothetical protein AAF712_008946 [Marasmius tenuissimus]|uniref:F-box domain-containing protein n=1 Tax=Marasmius tenuissimus TaxID=585030 RepID=A0ABR2ZQX8_9AGAR